MTAAVKDRAESPLWWRIARGTVRGTATMARIVYLEGRFVYGVAKTKTRMRYRRWKAQRTFTAADAPELDEVPPRRRRLFRPQYLCFSCGRKYSSARGLNKHFENVHADEPAKTSQAPVKILGRNSAGKVLVRLFKPQSSQHPTTNTRSTMSTANSTIALALKVAWSRMTEARPTRLSEIRADMVGLEQVLGGHAAESIAAYRAHLVRNVGFNPITVQRLLKACEQLEEAGKSFSAVIAAIDDFYADDIKAAKKRKGGERPSDETLTN